MIYEGETLRLFTGDFEAYGIGEDTVKKGCWRNRQGMTANWRHSAYPEDKRVIMVDYDSLPDRTKAKLPAKAELIAIAQGQTAGAKALEQTFVLNDLPELIKQCYNLSDFQFYTSKLPQLKVSTAKLKANANDLSRAASYLRFLNRYQYKTDTLTIGFNSKKDLRAATLELILEEAKQRGSHLYGFKVTNLAILAGKELDWRNAIAQAIEAASGLSKFEADRQAEEAALLNLIPGYMGNNNRRIIGQPGTTDKPYLIAGGRIDTKEYHASKLLKLYMNFGQSNKLDLESVHFFYKRECEREGQKPVSESSVKNFLTQNEVEQYVTKERHGWAEANKLLPKHSRLKPEQSLVKGGYDGLSVDFYSMVGGKRIMLTIVAVFDYYSEAVTGFDVNLVEDGLMVRNMWRNHLNRTGGRSYIEIESDRFSGNLAADTVKLFDSCVQFVSRPVPDDPSGRGSSPWGRRVERMVQELNRLAAHMPGWKGTNITSQSAKSRKPNPDYMTGNVVASHEEAIAQVIDLIGIYNNEKLDKFGGKSRIEMFQATLCDEAPVIDTISRAMLLNQHTHTTERAGIIKITVNRRDYEYNLPQADRYAHLMAKGRKVKVYYDEADMSSAHVFGYDPTDKDNADKDVFIATIGKLSRYHEAKHEQSSQDFKIMNEQKEERSARLRKIIEFEAAMLDVDITGLDTKAAAAVVDGAKKLAALASPGYREKFAEELATVDAVTEREYYTDRLISAQGMRPVEVKTAEDTRTVEERRREMVRRKFKGE